MGRDKDWKCTVCGYETRADNPPEKCPQCGAFRYRFIEHRPLSPNMETALAGAFAGESKAAVRNTAFARKAREEGYDQVARLFQAVAEAEQVHAHEFLKYLEGVVGDTADNLQAAFENEIKAKDDIYPELLEKAYAEKREDVVWSLVRSRDVEARHADLYKNALNALASDKDLDYHVCLVCGYVFDDTPPDNCPICRAERRNFKPIK